MKKVIGVGILVLVLVYSSCSSKEERVYNDYLKYGVSEKVIDFLNTYNQYGKVMMDEDIEQTAVYRQKVNKIWEVFNRSKREDFTEVDMRIIHAIEYFATNTLQKDDDDYTKGCIIVINLRSPLNDAVYGKSIS